MPKETAKFHFFDIDRCGYYAGREKLPLFGELTKTLHSLKEWSKSLRLVETKTFTPEDGSDLFPVYLLSIKNEGDAWLIITWNEVPSNEGTMPSISKDAQVGTLDIHENKLEEDSIPGFATYFYFIPSMNIFASVRFQHTNTGQQGLKAYIQSYLEEFSEYVSAYIDDDTKLEIKGYRVPNNKYDDDEFEEVTARFRTSLHKNPGKWDYIRDNIKSVTKIFKQSTLHYNRREHLAVWQRISRFISKTTPLPKSDHTNIQIEMETTLTIDIFEEIAENWMNRDVRESDDVGFKIKGNQDVQWLSESLAKCEIDLDIKRKNSEIIEPESLLKEIKKHHAVLMDAIICK